MQHKQRHTKTSRDIVTIEDLTNDEIMKIFSLADIFLETMGTGNEGTSRRIRGVTPWAKGFILATLFYEPSTRTRFSFESAMQRLGGSVVTAADPSTTSVTKGETIADTVRVLESYADAIVLRHPFEGAARVAADYTDIPVVNAGDGGHEHPTQTLCDLYTLQKKNKTLAGLNVLLYGDLKNGRTIHSLIYALARFGACIIAVPGTPGLELPTHVHTRLREEYGCDLTTSKNTADLPMKQVDVVYVTPTKPHQLALLDTEELKIEISLPKIDIFYVTRPQRERDHDTAFQNYPSVDRNFLSNNRFRDASVLHPLPRVDELSYEIDEDRRGIYFQQAAYGVPVRMALLAALLHLDEARDFAITKQPEENSERQVYSAELGLKCDNSRCITHHPNESAYLTPTFTYRTPQSLRCVYCEHELQPAFIGNSTTRKYTSCLSKRIKSKHLVCFSNEQQARDRGFELYKTQRSESEKVLT